MNHSDAARKFVEIVLKVTSLFGITVMLIILQETINISLLEPGVYHARSTDFNLFQVLFLCWLSAKVLTFKFTKEETK